MTLSTPDIERVRAALSIAAGWARTKGDSGNARTKIKEGLDAFRALLSDRADLEAEREGWEARVKIMEENCTAWQARVADLEGECELLKNVLAGQTAAFNDAANKYLAAEAENARLRARVASYGGPPQ